MSTPERSCLVCKQSQDHVPLIAVVYHGSNWWICPQHLPILIHKPQTLADVLPGADQLRSAGHHE